MSGSLPHDPAEGGVVIASNVPRIRTAVELLQGSQKRLLDRNVKRGCTTGHAELDKATGGLCAGFVWLFGAISSWGKSSMVVMVTDENIRLGKKVLIVTAEDDESLYGDRLMIRRSKVSADRFKEKRLTPDEYKAVAAVAAAGEDTPCFFDARGKSMEWTAARTGELIDEFDIDVVLFDYLQRFDTDKRCSDPRDRINFCWNTMADLIKLKKKTGIVFSQITPSDNKPYPDKYSIRESKDPANGAEVVVLGFTPEIDLERGDRVIAEARKKTLYLDKNKNGLADQFYQMDWNNDSACFEKVMTKEQKYYQEVTGGQFDDFGEDYAA